MSSGDATPRLGDQRFTFILPFHSSRLPRLSIQKSARVLAQPTSRVSEMAAGVGYKGERCAAHPSTPIFTLVNQRISLSSPPQSSSNSSLFHADMGRNEVSPAELVKRATANGYK